VFDSSLRHHSQKASGRHGQGLFLEHSFRVWQKTANSKLTRTRSTPNIWTMDHKTTIHAEMLREIEATDRMPLESPQEPKQLTGHFAIAVVIAVTVLIAVGLFVHFD
jgi:hypothetical protein